MHQSSLSKPHAQYSYFTLASTGRFAPIDGTTLPVNKMATSTERGRSFLSAPVCELVRSHPDSNQHRWTGKPEPLITTPHTDAHFVNRFMLNHNVSVYFFRCLNSELALSARDLREIGRGDVSQENDAEVSSATEPIVAYANAMQHTFQSTGKPGWI